MEFEESTRMLLRKIARELDSAVSRYNCESAEHEFLVDIIFEIEGALWAEK